MEVCFVEAAAGAGGDYDTLVCRLIEREYERGERVWVLCPDRAGAEALDMRLWAFDPDAFIPHGLIDQVGAETPVVLVPPEHPLGAIPRPVVCNLRPGAFAGVAARVIEPIPPDEPAKAAARERWRAYQRAGHGPRLERFAALPT